MRILVIGDIESKSLWDYFDPSKVEGVDLIISCGDLSPGYLEFLVTLSRCPVMYVHGNHDGIYEKEPPQGCICLEDKIVRYQGMRIAGLGGSMRYKKGSCMYTEGEMRMRAFRLRLKSLFYGGVDILVTHAPAKGWGDLEDLPHRGFQCFNTFLNSLRPKCMFHGHVHKCYGSFKREHIHESGTRLINAWDHYYIDI